MTTTQTTNEKNLIQKRALEMSRTHGCVDIVKLAKSFGIRVFGDRLSLNENAFIEHKDNEFKITVNEIHTPQRQYFSIGHELGHFILHKNKIKELGRLDRGGNHTLSKKEEEAADELGAQLLMPQKSIEEYAKKQNLTKETEITQQIVENLADIFDVSKFAVIMRLRKLNYYVPYISFD